MINNTLFTNVSDTSSKEYTTDIKRFTDWGGSVPSTPTQVCKYFTEFSSKNKYATLKRWKSSIAAVHSQSGFEDPTKNGLVVNLMVSICKEYGSTQRKVSTFSDTEIRAMVYNLDSSLKSKRDKCLLLIGSSLKIGRKITKLHTSDLKVGTDGSLVVFDTCIEPTGDTFCPHTALHE